MKRNWIDGVADLVFPSNIHCLLCGRQILPDEKYSLCGGCRERMTFLLEKNCCKRCGRPLAYQGEEGFCVECAGQKFYFEKAVSCLYYDDFSRKLIFQLKYGKKEYSAFHMAEMLMDRLEDSGIGGFDFIVPVPLHAKRERERGFNQAALLADSLGKMRGEPVLKKVLERNRQTEDQTNLGKKARFENLKGSFSTRNDDSIEGKRILLIDDVFTTGATSSDCSRALIDSGAGSVMVATVACR
ncbi:MAG: ComF family protein [Clostridiales bacterium]|nr:MAG: ComF family protein [Clostridiales bacterium]